MTELYRARKPFVKPPMYKDPQDLWDACVKYFDWVNANPLLEQKAFSYQGVGNIVHIEKQRVMHVNAMCFFLGVHRNTWMSWRAPGHHLAEVVHDVECIIAEQKFSGAAAGIFDPGLMGRDLGLVDKKATELSGSVETVTYTAADYKKAQDQLSLTLSELD